MDMAELSQLRAGLHQWLAENPRRIEWAAFHADVQALLRAAPNAPGSLRLPLSSDADRLIDMVHDLSRFLRAEALPLLQKRAGGRRPVPVISPFAGSSCGERPLKRTRLATTPAPACTWFASLNPGRTGLTALGSNNLLHWRLHAIASYLLENDIIACALPGARLPHGASFQPGFQFEYIGARSIYWDTVGFLVRSDMVESFSIMEDFGGERALWLRASGLDAPSRPMELFLCGFYPKHGGDIITWEAIIRDFKLLREQREHARLILMGDGNVHLKAAVDHRMGCTCAHCKQSDNDAAIERAIYNAGLRSSGRSVS